MSATEEEQEPDRSIEEIAEAGELEEPPVGMNIPLPGEFDSLTLNAGGKVPSQSQVVLRGGKLPVEGQFHKGSVMTLLVDVVVSEIVFADTHDEYGNATGTVRRHVMRPLAVSRSRVEEE